MSLYKNIYFIYTYNVCDKYIERNDFRCKKGEKRNKMRKKVDMVMIKLKQ